MTSLKDEAKNKEKFSRMIANRAKEQDSEIRRELDAIVAKESEFISKTNSEQMSTGPKPKVLQIRSRSFTDSQVSSGESHILLPSPSPRTPTTLDRPIQMICHRHRLSEHLCHPVVYLSKSPVWSLYAALETRRHYHKPSSSSSQLPAVNICIPSSTSQNTSSSSTTCRQHLTTRRQHLTSHKCSLKTAVTWKILSKNVKNVEKDITADSVLSPADCPNTRLYKQFVSQDGENDRTRQLEDSTTISCLIYHINKLRVKLKPAGVAIDPTYHEEDDIDGHYCSIRESAMIRPLKPRKYFIILRK
ncbi:unnamed protein product [Mytilus edulis]|uniref:Uncharacterized protein n=1 Tax=Mytilus edulis TaxID=6550 RepID=A0A8S3QR16_MYTED|nr:unnamed protein product [Mytilus edulis]